MDRAFDLTRQHGDERIDFAGAPEERHVNAARIVLVDQHGHMPALLQRAGKRHRRTHARGHEFAHQPLAQRHHGIRDGAEIGAAVKNDRIKSVARRDDGGQFPVGEMRGKNQRGLAIVFQGNEARNGFGRVIDERAFVGVARADVIEMRDLGGDAAEIVPHAAQNGFDLGVALVRKGGAQVVAPDRTHEGPGDVADGNAVAAANAGKQQRHKPSGHGVRRLLEATEHQPATLLPSLGPDHGLRSSR